MACALEGGARVRLEDDPFAGTKASRVDQSMVALGQLAEEIVFECLRFEIDILLGAAQRFKVTLHVAQVGVAGNQMGDHKSGIDDFVETQLLGDVVRRAEQICRRHLAIEEQRQAVEQQAAKV